jgi:hypothetical protein
MNNTIELFNDRLSEINLSFSVLQDIDDAKIKTNNNNDFECILKSNILLMIYNLIEACVVNGLSEIYESIKNNSVAYGRLIKEIQSIWSNYKIGKVYLNNPGRKAYEECVRNIIDDVIFNKPIELTIHAIKYGGNLDADLIKKLCDKHKIRYNVPDDKGYLSRVKEKRNSLAHGDVSFVDCARDMSLQDLKDIKDGVEQFITKILDGMKDYYDNRYYMKQQN